MNQGSAMRNNNKQQHVSVQKKDLGQFVERIQSESPMKEELKHQESFFNMSNVMNRTEINTEDANWFELRLVGKFPERRGYHSTFCYNKKYGIRFG